ncbi:restriction endonuclease subunit S [Acinetobacter sp. ASP199]|uniref:restriction endonuclease subunit S n=1 Tax=Acinetobacter sp. ASP199 TaxID=2773709 RepID=UPI001F611ED7|nr:restriction endonuclease subunit S [Acinetobacter sp. ASP199]UNT58254.1 restriction endonuclease subunit S [Acinetobacter sp. ASP199]
MTAPKLRFKEFHADWKLDLLGNLVQIKSGYSPSKYELEKSGEMPFLKVEELNNCDKYQEYSRFYTERNSDAVPSQSVIFPKRGAAILNNKVRILRVDALLDSNLMALIPQHSLDAEYLYYLINKIELYKIADTSTIPQINNKHIEPYSIYLPSKEEQTKIASFLSAVDEKISQLTQKHQLLSQYKQGMMQKLFSQQIRFKANDGSEFGEWEDKVLGDVIKFHNGKGHENNVDPNGKFILINSKFVSTDMRVFKKVTACNQKVFDDCLVMVMSDVPNGKAIAKVLYIEDGSKYALNQRIGMFVFNKINHPKFFQYQLNRHKYYLAFDSGVGQTNLKKEEVLSCPIFVPCLAEQTKIANFLSAMDQKIEVVAQQIEQAKTWKKGLLQQMFV